MDESRFRIICLALFGVSFFVLSGLVLLNSPNAFDVNPYSSQISCESGACTFTGKITSVSDKNSTIFYGIEKETAVDTVLFVGSKKPTFVVGDCVNARGIAQEYQGKQSIVIQELRACKNSTS